MGTAYDSSKAREVFPKLMAYHRWFCNARDPQGKGVIGIIHPWESGRDNCPDWDIGMKGITVPDNLMSYIRRDASYVDSDQRPSQAQYDRFITIVQFAQVWDHHAIYARGPFRWPIPECNLSCFVPVVTCRNWRIFSIWMSPLTRFEAGSTVSQRGVTGFGMTILVAIARATFRRFQQRRLPTPRCSASLPVWVRRTSAPVLAHCRRHSDSCRYGMPSWDPEHRNFEPKRGGGQSGRS